MNDVEKKKTIFQVLSRLKEIYSKFQLILEWTKVSNEHLTLKTIIFDAKMAKDNLNRLIGGIFINSNYLQTRKHAESKFNAVKDLFSVCNRVPRYFAPSIEALAPLKIEILSEKERNSWLFTLESVLRTEISKNIISISRNDYKIISIDEGKAKVLFLNLFEFEFTIVPSVENSLNSAWFILGVQVHSMNSLTGIFKNSLTGIFQFKYNNDTNKSLIDTGISGTLGGSACCSTTPTQNATQATSNTASNTASHTVSQIGPQYFKSIISDCSKYIELFYYEKMFSQFSFLSNFYGKSICSFQKSPNGDWFKFKPWFMTEESVVSNDSRFKAEGEVAAFMIPKLSFDEREAKNIFEQLFGLIYKSKLEEFFKIETEKGIINNFMNRNHYNCRNKKLNYKMTCCINMFTFDIELFEGFVLILKINPFTKKFKFDVVDSLTLENYEENLENSLINFDFELFEETIFEIKREILLKTIKSRNSEFSIVSCLQEVSSKTEICLQLKKEPSLAFSINLNKEINIKFWKITLNFQNGFMDMKFKELGIKDTEASEGAKATDELKINGVKSVKLAGSVVKMNENLNFHTRCFPRTIHEFDILLKEQEGILLEISSKFSFENLIKSIGGIEGEFVLQGKEGNVDSFRILSLGLPNCIKTILLSLEDHMIKVKVELEGLKRDDLETKLFKQDENGFFLNYLKGIIKLLTIFEYFNILEEGKLMEIENFEPLQLKYQETRFYLNEAGRVEVFFNEIRLLELENFIDADNFNIYDFSDKLSNLDYDNLNRNDQEGSPDLTWLSDSFM